MLSLPSGRRLLLLDALVVLWVVAWLVAGAVVGLSVYQLTELTGAFRNVGGAIAAVGDTLGNVRVPLLGGPLQAASEAVSGAGRDVAARGVAVRAEIIQASAVLGLAVALTPIVLVLAAYAPARSVRAREVSALRAMVAADGGAPELEALLAERALRSLPYHRLRAVASRPWEDDLVTRRALADAELRRLGVRSPWRGRREGAG